MAKIYSLFKHVFFWTLEALKPEDESTDDILCFWLSEIHTMNNIFYHWSWYVFVKILKFYEKPEHKIRFLFNISSKINEIDHTWGTVPDDPIRVSLGRRPRPILQLLLRTAYYNNFEHKTWKSLALKINHKDEKDPGFAKKFWIQFKSELREAREASLWERDSTMFQTTTSDLELKNIESNIPLHVLMERENNQ